MGRPRLHDEATAASLLDAAEALLQAEGLEALTVRRVAKATGTSTRAIYSSLGSKEALVANLGTRAFELLDAQVRAVPLTDDPTADLVNVAIRGFRAWALSHPAFFRVGFEHRVEIPTEVSASFQPSADQALTGLIALIERMQQADLLGGRSVQQATRQFAALCEGLALLDLRCDFPERASLSLWTDALNALVAGWQRTP
jgi:AcrR family transcriptional regulator